MKKNQKEKEPYLAPQCEVFTLENTWPLLQGSRIKPTPGVGNPAIEVDDNEEYEEELDFG